MANIYDVDSLEFWQIVKGDYIGKVNGGAYTLCQKSKTFRIVWDDEEGRSKQKIREYAFYFLELEYPGFGIVVGLEYLFVILLTSLVDDVCIREMFIDYMINKLSNGK